MDRFCRIKEPRTVAALKRRCVIVLAEEKVDISGSLAEHTIDGRSTGYFLVILTVSYKRKIKLTLGWFCQNQLGQ